MSAHAQLRGRELVERHVRGFLIVMFHDEGWSDVRPLIERHETSLLATDPVGAFRGDGLLRELVAQADLQWSAIQALFAFQAWDVEFALFLGGGVLGECL